MELKTPLYDAHVKAGGKIVPFAGYLLPVQYETGVIKEHMAVRTQAGLFVYLIWRNPLRRKRCSCQSAAHPYKRFYKYGRRTGKIQSDV